MSESSSAILRSQTTSSTMVQFQPIDIPSEMEIKRTAEQEASDLKAIIHRQLAPPRSMSRWAHLCSLPSAEKSSLRDAFITGGIAGCIVGGTVGVLAGGPSAPIAAPIGAAAGFLVGGVVKTIVIYRMEGIDYSSWKDLKMQKTDEVVKLLFLNMEDWTGLIDPVSKDLFQVPLELPCSKNTPHVYDKSTVDKLISSKNLRCPTCNVAFKANEVRASYATLSRMTTFCIRILNNPTITVQMTEEQIANFKLIMGNVRKVSDTFFELEMAALNKKLSDKKLTREQFTQRVNELNRCLSGDVISVAGH